MVKKMGSGHGGVCEVKSLAFPCYFTLPIDIRTRKLYVLLLFCVGPNLGFTLGGNLWVISCFGFCYEPKYLVVGLILK